MRVTVLIESASEGCSLGIVADAMMDENKDDDIAIIVRINGFDSPGNPSPTACSRSGGRVSSRRSEW
ncbi:hypothetical protein [Magnetospirillum sp. SS-4]|uniref:hypothetical protein n=1 Tax=Magnetospirillum sp. SS-4 TaxID=2681465 RepID=UPI001574584D|nr:hypothetical protein [Magnetospirillum sp. SS-4]